MRDEERHIRDLEGQCTDLEGWRSGTSMEQRSGTSRAADGIRGATLFFYCFLPFSYLL